MSRYVTALLLGVVLGAMPVSAATQEQLDELQGEFLRLQNAQQFKKALPIARRTLRLATVLYPDDLGRQADFRVQLGITLRELGDREAAYEQFLKAVDSYASKPSTPPMHLINALDLAANSTREWRVATAHLQTMHDVLENRLAEAPMNRADALIRLGLGYSRIDPRESLPRYEQALDIYTKANDLAGIAQAQFFVGQASFAMGGPDLESAEQAFKAAVEASERMGDMADRQFLELSHSNLVRVLEALNKSNEATIHCRVVAQLLAVDGQHKPQALYLPEPRYPLRDLAAQRSGAVLLSLDVTPDGRTENVEVSSKLDSTTRMRKNAVEAVSRYRYAPAIERGELVRTNGVEVRVFFDYTNHRR